MARHGKLTRIAVFYDGNYFLHVSNYYNYHHPRGRRIDIAGLHEFIRARVAEEEDVDVHRCAITDGRYFRGRLSAKSASQQAQRLYYDRVFGDKLMSEYVRSVHLPLRSSGGRLEEKGIDVAFAVEAMSLAALDQVDVIVVVASDGDFVPLIRKLPALGVRTMLLSWNYEFEDDAGRRQVTRTAQDLTKWATYPVDMTAVIDDPLDDEVELVEGLFVGADARAEAPGEEARGREVEVVEYDGDEEVESAAIISLKNGYGFIEWPDNNLFFYHGDVEGVEFRALRVGDRVRFVIGENDRGDDIARRVSLAELDTGGEALPTEVAREAGERDGDEEDGYF